MKCVLINRNDETNVRQKEGDKTWGKKQSRSRQLFFEGEFGNSGIQS